MADIGELAALLAQLWVMSVELNPHGFWGPCLAGLWAQAPQVFHPELVAGDSLAAGQLADSGLVKLPPFVASDPALSPDRCPQPRCLRLRLPLRAWEVAGVLEACCIWQRALRGPGSHSCSAIDLLYGCGKITVPSVPYSSHW